jgi:hypothetical protein
MIRWQAATALFFVYIGVLAAAMPRLGWRRRRQSLAGSAAGLLIVLANTRVQHPVLNDWVIPPLVLLLAYWTSGLLWVAPMPRVERALVTIDCALRVRRICAATPRPLAEFLEMAYAAVYVVIPIALVLERTIIDRPDAARFWTVILVTDYICFGMLPWIQTRPPRAIEPGEPWTAKFRAWNLRLLRNTSIQVNTFPSGHAAEAMAAALLLIGAPAPIVTLMFLSGLSVSAGAVLGRYHYAADVFAGWLVAALIFLAEGL